MAMREEQVVGRPMGVMAPGPTTELTAARFEELYRELWPGILNYVRFRLGPEDAPDVAAEVFARAWARRESFDPMAGSPAAWLWGIAKNATVDWARKGRTPSGGPAPLPAQEPDPGHSVEVQDDVRQLLGAVRALPAEDREIIALRFGLGLPNKEVAQLLSLTDGNAAVRLHRAVRKLRLALSE
jgi:RNA polymerase sigma-70 factor (ECF subfamily)